MSTDAAFRSGRPRMMRSLRLSCAVAFFFAVRLAAEMPYVTNLNTALEIAKSNHLTVLFYSGRAEKCLSNSPPAQLFQRIFPNHPRLAARSNEFVVCEHFGYAPAKDATGGVHYAFSRDVQMLEPLFDRYDIRFFWPSVTFLDAEGNRLNGPFSYLMDEGWIMDGAQELFSNGRDCYATLDDYTKAARPVRLSEAQSNLVAAVTRPVPAETGVAFFRFTYLRKGGARPLLMENGLMSDRFELGKPFSFAVRDGTNAWFPGHTTQWPISYVTVAGQLKDIEPFADNFLLRINGVYFETKAMFSGTGPDYCRGYAGGIPLGPGEYCFGIETRQKIVGDILLRECKALR